MTSNCVRRNHQPCRFQALLLPCAVAVAWYAPAPSALAQAVPIVAPSQSGAPEQQGPAAAQASVASGVGEPQPQVAEVQKPVAAGTPESRAAALEPTREMLSTPMIAGETSAPVDVSLGSQQVLDAAGSVLAAAHFEGAPMMVLRPSSGSLLDGFVGSVFNETTDWIGGVSIAPGQVRRTEQAHSGFKSQLIDRARQRATSGQATQELDQPGYFHQLFGSVQISLAAVEPMTRLEKRALVDTHFSAGLDLVLYDSSWWSDSAARCAFHAADSVDVVDRVVRSVRLAALSAIPGATPKELLQFWQQKQNRPEGSPEEPIDEIARMHRDADNYAQLLLVSESDAERAAILSQFFYAATQECGPRSARFIIGFGGTGGFRLENKHSTFVDRGLASLTLDIGSRVSETSKWGLGLTLMARTGKVNGFRFLDEGIRSRTSDSNLWQLGGRVSLPARWCSFAAEAVAIYDLFLDSEAPGTDVQRRWGGYYGASATLPIMLGLSASLAFHVRATHERDFDSEQIGTLAISWRKGPGHEAAALKAMRRYRE